MFFSDHVQQHKYIICIKKCNKSSCKVCQPVRMPIDTFKKITERPRIVPFPQPDPNRLGHFDATENIKSKPTDDRHMPSFKKDPKPSKESREMDKKSDMHFITNKVRHRIRCGECSKYRGVYANKKPAQDALEDLVAYTEDVVYICGAPLFDDESLAVPESAASAGFGVRRALTCFVPQEKALYSCKIFAPSCVHCGCEQASQLASADQIGDLNGKKAYPICVSCLMEEKFEVVTWGSEDKTNTAYKSVKGSQRRMAADKSFETDDEVQLDSDSEDVSRPLLYRASQPVCSVFLTQLANYKIGWQCGTDHFPEETQSYRSSSRRRQTCDNSQQPRDWQR